MNGGSASSGVVPPELGTARTTNSSRLTTMPSPPSKARIAWATTATAAITRTPSSHSCHGWSSGMPSQAAMPR